MARCKASARRRSQRRIHWRDRPGLGTFLRPRSRGRLRNGGRGPPGPPDRRTMSDSDTHLPAPRGRRCSIAPHWREPVLDELVGAPPSAARRDRSRSSRCAPRLVLDQRLLDPRLRAARAGIACRPRGRPPLRRAARAPGRCASAGPRPGARDETPRVPDRDRRRRTGCAGGAARAAAAGPSEISRDVGQPRGSEPGGTCPEARASVASPERAGYRKSIVRDATRSAAPIDRWSAK